MPIKDIKAELCFDLPNGETKNGTQLQLWWCNGSDAQDFYYDESSKRIRHRPTNKCVDLNNNDRSDGNRIHLWDCGETDAQKWEREWVGDKHRVWGFNLANDSRKCIEASGGLNGGSKLQIKSCNSGTKAWGNYRESNQKFAPSMEGDTTPLIRHEDGQQAGLGDRDGLGKRWCEKHNYSERGNWHEKGEFYYNYTCNNLKPLTDDDKRQCCDENLFRDKEYIVSNGVEKKCPGEFKQATGEFCRNYFDSWCQQGDNIFSDKCQKIKGKNDSLYIKLMTDTCKKEGILNGNDNNKKKICNDFCDNRRELCPIFRRLDDCKTMGLSNENCTENKVNDLKATCQNLTLWTPLGGSSGLSQCTETAIKELKADCKKYGIENDCTPIRRDTAKSDANLEKTQRELADEAKKIQEERNKIIQEKLTKFEEETDEEEPVTKPVKKLTLAEDQSQDNTMMIMIIVAIIIFLIMSSSSMGILLL